VAAAFNPFANKGGFVKNMKKLFVMVMLLPGIFVFADPPPAWTSLEITPFEGAWKGEGSDYELVFIGSLILAGDAGDRWNVAGFSHDGTRLYLLEDSGEKQMYSYSLSGNTLRLADENEELVFIRFAGQTGPKTELEGIWQVEIEGENFTLLFRKNFMILMEMEEAVMFSLKNGQIVVEDGGISYTVSGDTLVFSDENESIELQRIGP
jgi:hypothetical protein